MIKIMRTKRRGRNRLRSSSSIKRIDFLRSLTRSRRTEWSSTSGNKRLRRRSKIIRLG